MKGKKKSRRRFAKLTIASWECNFVCDRKVDSIEPAQGKKKMIRNAAPWPAGRGRGRRRQRPLPPSFPMDRTLHRLNPPCDLADEIDNLITAIADGSPCTANPAGSPTAALFDSPSAEPMAKMKLKMADGGSETRRANKIVHMSMDISSSTRQIG